MNTVSYINTVHQIMIWTFWVHIHARIFRRKPSKELDLDTPCAVSMIVQQMGAT